MPLLAAERAAGAAEVVARVEREESCEWWRCPDLTCRYVIPDEHQTPDGADFVVWPALDRDLR